jgi:hypothetical protein
LRHPRRGDDENKREEKHMIIDAWGQHPTLRFAQEEMFASLRRWTKADVPTKELPVSLFKNKNGPYFKISGDRKTKPAYRDYEMPLLDKNGLYEHLALYLKVARPRILRGRRSAALFVGSRKYARFSAGALDQLCRRLYVKHLIFNPLRQTGFPGSFVQLDGTRGAISLPPEF